MDGLRIISQECAADREHAWALFCNIAVPIMDATGLPHKAANEAAAHLMQHLFECDITTHEHYEYEKSGAQSYAEFRIAMDEQEDAEIAASAIEARRAETGTGSVHESADPKGDAQ